MACPVCCLCASVSRMDPYVMRCAYTCSLQLEKNRQVTLVHTHTHTHTHINTCTFHCSSVLDFIYPSFPSLSFSFSLLMKPWAWHTIKPLGPHSIVRRVHTTPFSVVEALLLCRDNTHTNTHETRKYTQKNPTQPAVSSPPDHWDLFQLRQRCAGATWQ